MKKFLVLAVVSLLILSVFAACGSGDEMKNDMTTMMDDMSSALDNMMDPSEGRGEVTEDETTEEITTEDLTDEMTSDETTNELEGDITEAESNARSILDDITE